ncbi:MAG TPA: twin-arginine translocation signal domain-containing protein [Burkholderiales bacterium]|nr:twin-arginine translocation signal domain-containing protein [Burkholderiales bacterium]
MTKTDVTRRRFLTALGLGGAAAAAAVAGRKGGESAQQAPASGQRSAGYRLTEHVRRYYETAKV